MSASYVRFNRWAASECHAFQLRRALLKNQLAAKVAVSIQTPIRVFVIPWTSTIDFSRTSSMDDRMVSKSVDKNAQRHFSQMAWINKRPTTSITRQVTP